MQQKVNDDDDIGRLPTGENVITTLAHADFGDPGCFGWLHAVIADADHACIFCNECRDEVRLVKTTDLHNTLNEMELSLVLATVVCPTCNVVNLFPGFSSTMAFICQSCGRRINLQPQ